MAVTGLSSKDLAKYQADAKRLIAKFDANNDGFLDLKETTKADGKDYWTYSTRIGDTDFVMRTTVSTPASPAKCSLSSSVGAGPIAPISVRDSPSLTWGMKPRLLTSLTTFSIDAASASLRMTMTMGPSLALSSGPAWSRSLDAPWS